MPVYEREVAHNWNWLTLCRREPGKALCRCCQRWILKDKFYKQTKVDQGKRKDIAKRLTYSKARFSSIAQSCPTLCDPMDCSTPGLPVHHQLLESTQTHVH